VEHIFVLQIVNSEMVDFVHQCALVEDIVRIIVEELDSECNTCSKMIKI
jgi:hypothetical protein